MGTSSVISKNLQQPSFQISELWNDKQCLEKLIGLYFDHEGQTKAVAQSLGIRRNTVIDVITQRMIPHVAKLWIQQCQGDKTKLAERLRLEENERFYKTLRWHHRFESYLASIEVDSHNGKAISKALHFLRKIPEPLSAFLQKRSPLKSSVSQKGDLLYQTEPGTDNVQSISCKISKLKLLKFGTIMILGETGAGKGWLAHRIYQYLYPKGEKPYLHINCAHLISASIELFGSVRGAFTDAINKKGAFELVANGGVIFLDEIDALPMEVQMKLLLVLGEDGVFYRAGSTTPVYLNRFTLITATNQDLEYMVSQQKFRLDLLGRINQPCIRLKTWHQQPLEVKRHIINELQIHISENDFEVEYTKLLQKGFKLTDEQLDILLNSQYTYNVRSVRKQITEFMAQFIIDSATDSPKPFQLQ